MPQKSVPRNRGNEPKFSDSHGARGSPTGVPLTTNLMLEIMARGRTHVGKVRAKNEDNFCIDTDLGLFMVADGMGGHASGEIASRMALDVIKETYEISPQRNTARLVGKRNPKLSKAANRLLGSVRFANRAVFELSQKEHPDYGMGTTLVGLLAQRDRILQLHVGDSRIYRVRDGNIEQLTEDHSLVMEQFKMGLLTEDEARLSPAKNVITRAIGIDRDVDIAVRQHRWIEGDTYLLCSDGFSDLVASEEIPDILEHHDFDLEDSSEAFVHLALERGGHDNITVVLVRLGKKQSKIVRLGEKVGEWLGFHQ